MFFRKKTVDDFVTRGNKNTYDATDVAVYIINYCAEQKRPINNLYLQKLMYLVYSFFLVETTERKHLFKSPMVAWYFGPAFPEVYYAFETYHCNVIPSLDEYRSIMSFDKKYAKHIDIADKDKELIKYVVDKYRDRTLGDIVFMTQSQKPWSEAYGLSSNGAAITDNAIVEYFSNHRQR